MGGGVSVRASFVAVVVLVVVCVCVVVGGGGGGGGGGISQKNSYFTLKIYC